MNAVWILTSFTYKADAPNDIVSMSDEAVVGVFPDEASAIDYRDNANPTVRDGRIQQWNVATIDESTGAHA